MRIRELLSTGRPSFSFEFFPPKTDDGLVSLRNSILSLRELSPTYVSVTYGAGGSTRDRTVDLVTQIQREHNFEAMAHLTCVGSSVDELRSVLDRLTSAGVENVLALRGDPPRGSDTFVPHPDGFRHSDELTRFIKSRYGFCIGGACYPEGHVECVAPSGERDLSRDLDNLKRKVDGGAEFLITQLFFDNDRYFEFVSRARRAGIGVPIIPGIMPITNVDQVRRFTSMCGASIPRSLLDELDRLKENEFDVLSLGVAYATAQCFELLQKGAPGVHFYTLNKSAATRTILTAIRTIWPPAMQPASKAPRPSA